MEKFHVEAQLGHMFRAFLSQKRAYTDLQRKGMMDE